MRLEAQMLGGFYPIPIPALDKVLSYLVPEVGCTLLDPCAGKGVAVGYLAHKLGIEPKDVYAIELEEGRAADLAPMLPGSKVLAPADFHQTDISASSFSLVWCNPPFDDEIGGGGRVEMSFLLRAIRLVATKGIICLVCPEGVMSRDDMRREVLSNFDSVSCRPFPEEHRRFREVVVMGRKRPRAVEVYKGWLETVYGQTEEPCTLRAADGPRRFAKSGLTDAEILRAMAASPLNRVFVQVCEAPIPTPPLELRRGQLALVLAGGLLNTTLQKPGETPILIKATPYKETYVSSEETEVKHEGTDREDTVTTVVTSERIKLKVRVMDATGKIHDLA
jgi:hypothetical protein